MIVTGGENVYSIEVENAIASHPAVLQVAVIGVPSDEWGEAVHAIVVLREGAELDEDLEKAIAKRVREDCSPRHVPNEVFEVEEIPRTLSGKVLEVPVKRILTGTPAEQAASRDSLQNPEALDYFVGLAVERG